MSRYIHLPRNKSLTSLAKALRKNMTEEERYLWFHCLKESPFRFSRQKIIGDYIVDFYCDSARLVVELDGGQHYEEEGLAYDAQRTAYLEELGIKVMRFSNFDVKNNFDVVRECIYQELREKSSA